MSTPTPTFTKPAGIILVKGSAAPIYGIWPSGYIREITLAEWTLWGQPAVDYTIPKTDAAQAAQFAAYNKALQG